MKSIKKLSLFFAIVLMIALIGTTVCAEETSAYAYTLKCTQTSETTVKAELFVSGGKVQSGSFGFSFDPAVVKSISFAYESYAEQGSQFPLLYSVGANSGITGENNLEVTADKNYIKYIDSWIYETYVDPIYIDASTDAKKLGEFTITLNEGQHIVDSSISVAAPSDADAYPKAYNGTSYLVAPYSVGLGIAREPIATNIELQKSTVTFKLNAMDESAHAVSEATLGSAITFPAAPTKDSYTFKYWSVDGINAFEGTTHTAENVTLIAVFEYQSTLSHVYTVQAQVSGNKLVANLYYKGGVTQSGTFGIGYDTSVLTLDNFKLADSAAELVGPITSFFADDKVNGIYYNRWIYQDHENKNIFIDASTEKKLIGTFTFTIADGATFKADDIYHSVENYPDVAKGFVDDKFVVSPYSNDASVVHEAVDFAPIEILPEIAGPTTVNVSIVVGTISETILYNITDGDRTYSSAAKLAITDTENNEVVTATQTEIGVWNVEADLEIGATYTITVEKNGYLKETVELTVTESTDSLDITMIPGDIKEAFTDFAGNGVINIKDFIRVIRGFDSESSEIYKAVVDINEDGSVSIDDLIHVKNNFGKSAK